MFIKLSMSERDFLVNTDNITEIKIVLKGGCVIYFSTSDCDEQSYAYCDQTLEQLGHVLNAKDLDMI